MSDVESDTEEVTDLSNSDVTTKYRAASDIAQKALLKVIEACVADADICEICELGDNIIEEATGKLYNKKVKGKAILKGVAFPTCVAVNEVMGNYCPLKGESTTLKNGDVAKIELACHIDGYVAAAGHTIVVGGEKVEDRRADAIMAAYQAAEAAVRLVQVGNKSTVVADTMNKIADEYKCKFVFGATSHQMKKHVFEGTKTIMPHQTEEHKAEEFEFEPNEVYGINVVMSTGDGKGKEMEVRHTVYKRAPDVTYLLKTAKARQFISEISKRYPALPFTLRAFEDQQMARLGVSEAKRHELLEEYTVLQEKKGNCVAQFKFTVLLLPGGAKKVTGLPLGEAEKNIVSSLSIQDEEIKKLLAQPANQSSKAKKKKEKGAKKEEGEAAA
mmetsp:Transcript_70925/g.148365  ORF Transcript_70925/g.148365 Transcript_70925/m.148365 type:complete len:387 (+) Transcript_70925:95-1255(+)|eukprot:CAMPEP_0206467686 /NCGR_PEP_ID=MMETSP0324_2-20121206/29182_1 /ASSEMBLY_ACC=CAM_ASM_000836 /TAXON_ID=2866 /ORGANISM="Crypthecodinium cohnii, Strain Seligo" /LENGTH=386 /DNA_ID=CAMNT_0053941001 /DNA_START=90 /DNA_END=1250 /DNA_ORIENTATION=+